MAKDVFLGHEITDRLSHFSASECKVYIALVMCSDPHGMVVHTHGDLATIAGLNRETVLLAIKNLHKGGLVEIVRIVGRASVYRVARAPTNRASDSPHYPCKVSKHAGAVIGCNALAVYTLLHGLAEGNGWKCWLSSGRIAEMLAMSLISVARALRVLMASGLIRTGGYGEAPAYWLQALVHDSNIQSLGVVVAANLTRTRRRP